MTDIVKRLRSDSFAMAGRAGYQKVSNNMAEAVEEIEKLRTENEALKKAQEWQPIETAPKNNWPDMVLAWEPNLLFPVPMYYKSGEWWSDLDSIWEPTVWMPLPTPPKGQDDE